ncbi:MAG TPA: CDP-glucose 4,6-dehydratase, partial [Chthoniobacteraceae bacterium]|nr:CDP-glucose 4,6-dehydratase [Chthoniobacteraceae bacterium]
TVCGIALEPNTQPSIFEQIGLRQRLEHHLQDIREGGATGEIVRRFRPDFVFHLAAQPLVRLSYERPVETWETNVLGAIHILESLRLLDHPCAAVFVTTDKCYENREWLYAYREMDAMGGHDPYSSSKGAAEIAIAAWRRSFLHSGPVRVASARAGNVIGGGDWALDRIVPDAMRALSKGESIPVRNPNSTRPWQHVLEPLSGYLWLAALMAGAESDQPGRYCDAFNFGPRLESNRNVAALVTEILKHRPGQWASLASPGAPHEAALLNLSIEKAFHLLKWSPAWNFEETIAQTAAWYFQDNMEAAAETTRSQIAAYTGAAAKAGIAWAVS